MKDEKERENALSALLSARMRIQQLTSNLFLLISLVGSR